MANEKQAGEEIFQIENGKLIKFLRDDLTSVEIPEGITEIGKNAFSECKNLESVKFPESLEIIEKGAFEDCSALKEIKLPKNVKTIVTLLLYHTSSF